MGKTTLSTIFISTDYALFTSFRARFAESGLRIEQASDQGAFTSALREAPAAVLLDSSCTQAVFGMPLEDSVRKLSALLGSRVVMVLAEPDLPAPRVVSLLELGAHDVVQKPVNPRILAEQVKALVRVFARRSGQQRPVLASSADAIAIDYPRRKCFVRAPSGPQSRREVRLTRMELLVLWLLLQKKGAVVTYEDFAGRLWPEAASHREITHTLHQLVTNIRRKIAPCAAAIENVRAEGFRLE